MEFLNGESDNDGQEISGTDDQVGQPSSVGDPDANEGLASEVKEELENYSSLQYHFFCGTSWTNAHETCATFCPSGDKNDCPEGEECYANTRCDGRDTPPPTESPAPSVGGNGVDGDICTVCEGTAKLDATKSIDFQTQTTSCGNIDALLLSGNILVDSAICNSIRDEYDDPCCYDECQLCRTSDGNFLDLRSEHVVKQGGYEATCQDISSILNTMAESDDTCNDAQTQMGEECCYQQCTLCGDESATGMSTEWYATVSFQGLTTTCLGLDYYLRAEQINDGSETCGEFRGTYMDRCCYAQNSCQLCRAEDKLYEIDPTMTVTIQQPARLTTLTCPAVDDSMSKLDKDDQACTDGRQAFFEQCCDLGNAIVLDSGVVPVGAPQPQPSPGQLSPGQPPPGQPSAVDRPNGTPSAGTTLNDTSDGEPVSATPSSSSSPSSEGGFATNKPTSPYYWGGDDDKPPLTWYQEWDPPDDGSRQAGGRAVLFLAAYWLLGLLLFV